jgi:hypothetical protein
MDFVFNLQGICSFTLFIIPLGYSIHISSSKVPFRKEKKNGFNIHLSYSKEIWENYKKNPIFWSIFHFQSKV